MALITSRPKSTTTVDGLPLAYQLFTEGNYVPLVVEVERTTITDDLTDSIVVFSASGGNGNEYYISKSSEYPGQISLISITNDRIKALVKLVKEDTLFFLDNVTNFQYSVGLKTNLGLMELERGYFNVNPSIALGKLSQAPVPDAPPVIELIAPQSNQKLFVNKPVKLLAKASDLGGGIEKVDFYANEIKIGTNSSYSQKGTWDFRYNPTQAGSVTFYAIATDSSGYTSKSNAVAVSVDPEPIIPTANFSFSPLTGSAPLSVTFTNTSVNASSYSWNFGDGTAVSTAIAPTHIYQVSGNYTITLTATNTYGSVSITKVITVDVATNQPPTISVTNPTNNSNITVGQQVALTATASDGDGSISSVQFKVNNTNLGSPITSSPYTTSWTPSVAGSYTITAVATDNLGLTTTSAAIATTVTIPVNQAPVISVTAPANNASLTTNQAVTLTATANDPDGTIALVQFKVNGVNLNAPVTTSPYTTSWTPTVAGNYTITATATDNGGTSTTSAAIAVVAAAPTIPVPTVAIASAVPSAGMISIPITLSATASISGDTLTGTQFKVNNSNQGTLQTGGTPSVSWTPTAKGVYSITATATGSQGGSTTSAVKSIQAFDTKATGGGASAAGASLGAASADYILYDNNQSAGGNAATMNLFVGGSQIGAFNFPDAAYVGKPFAYFYAATNTLYTKTIAAGTVNLP